MVKRRDREMSKSILQLNIRLLIVVMILVTALVALPAVAFAGSSAPGATQGVWLTPIGNPTWMPVDFHLFSAPIGTADTGYAEFLENALAILPPPNHSFHPDLGVGPGEPHQPPYDSEIAEGVASLGYHEGVRFHSTEFSNGNGVWLVWMNVPAPGATGSSPDFASGAIIPNNLFPIHVEGVSSRNGRPFDPNLSIFDVPALDQNLDPPFTIDGHSHFPVFIADNADFGPPGIRLIGSYRYRITMMDTTGSGWRINVHFAVAP